MIMKQMSAKGCINLVGGIIFQAIEDLSNPDSCIRNEAKAYFFSDDFEYYCTACGVAPNYIREQIEVAKGVDFKEIFKELNHNYEPAKRAPRGFLKQMSAAELKAYRSTYRKARAKLLAAQKWAQQQSNPSTSLH